MLALRATRALSRTLPTLAQQHRALHASSPAARAIEHLTSEVRVRLPRATGGEGEGRREGTGAAGGAL